MTAVAPLYFTGMTRILHGGAGVLPATERSRRGRGRGRGCDYEKEGREEGEEQGEKDGRMIWIEIDVASKHDHLAQRGRKDEAVYIVLAHVASLW